MQMDMLKKKSKISGLQALIAQMHKAMMKGDGDKPTSVEEAIESSEGELGMGNHKDAAEEGLEEKMDPGIHAKVAKMGGDEEAGEDAIDPSLHEKIKEYMKKSGKVPVKGKTVMIKADMSVKKPMMGKKKYG